YRMIGFDMFDEMQQGIVEDTIRLMYHIKVEQKIQREEVAKPMATNRSDDSVRKPKLRESKKVYPNDPCPCGSGKKYKNCCGRKGKR
ncbi:MAG: SEC-C domain-containing protein, partial [Lachnospiraceae bacterium]|nr:SEC-C domain-containing protein [Lachnospiraceae bacterium]